MRRGVSDRRKERERERDEGERERRSMAGEGGGASDVSRALARDDEGRAKDVRAFRTAVLNNQKRRSLAEAEPVRIPARAKHETAVCAWPTPDSCANDAGIYMSVRARSLRLV